MMIRTSSKTVTFVEPFVLRGLDGVQPAGSYTVETDEEFLDTVASPAYRRVATLIHLHATRGNPSVARAMPIDPEELNAALRRDVMLSETPLARPTISFARRRAHRARTKALLDLKKLESY